jgi:hypothetical protein
MKLEQQQPVTPTFTPAATAAEINTAAMAAAIRIENRTGQRIDLGANGDAPRVTTFEEKLSL